jgi:hypothetical protein
LLPPLLIVATSPLPLQLILPESLKLLPLYTLALTKNPAFRANAVATTAQAARRQATSGGVHPGIVRPDERSYLLHQIASMDVASSVKFLYPDLYALHDMPEEVRASVGRNRQLIAMFSIPTTCTAHLMLYPYCMCIHSTTLTARPISYAFAALFAAVRSHKQSFFRLFCSVASQMRTEASSYPGCVSLPQNSSRTMACICSTARQ